MLTLVVSLVAGGAVERAYRVGKIEILLYNGSALILRDGNATGLILERMSDSNLDYLYSYMMTRGIIEVDTIIILDENEVDMASVEAVFSGGRVYNFNDTDEAIIDVGEISVDVEGDCVIIKTKGKTVVFAKSDSDLLELADSVVLWQSADRYLDKSYQNVICYEDLKGGESAVLRYGFSKHVEFLIGEDYFRTRIR